MPVVRMALKEKCFGFQMTHYMAIPVMLENDRVLFGEQQSTMQNYLFNKAIKNYTVVFRIHIT